MRNRERESMYFGDWLRTSNIKKEWYISYSSKHDDYVERISKAVKKKGQVSKISPTCLLIESIDTQKSVIKNIRKVLKKSDKTVFLYPHHKLIGHMQLTPLK